MPTINPIQNRTVAPTDPGSDSKPVDDRGVTGAGQQDSVDTFTRRANGGRPFVSDAGAQRADQTSSAHDAVLDEIKQLIDLGGFGAARKPLHERIEKGLEIVGRVYPSVAAASKLVPWESWDAKSQDAELKDAELLRAAAAVRFLMRAGLPRELRSSIHDLLELARSSSDLAARVLVACQVEGQDDVSAIAELCTVDDPNLRRAALKQLAKTTGEVGVSMQQLGAILESALSDADEEVAQAGLDAALSVPLRKETRRKLADLASAVMATEDDDGNRVPRLDLAKVVQLLVESQPSEKDAMVFFKRAFEQGTRAQHVQALRSLDMFGLSENGNIRILNHSIKKWPLSIGEVVRVLPKLSMSDDASKPIVELALRMQSNLRDTFEASGASVPNEKELAEQQDYLGASLVDWLTGIPAATDLAKEVLDGLEREGSRVVRVALLDGAAELITNKHPLAADAEAYWLEALAGEDTPVAQAALRGLDTLAQPERDAIIRAAASRKIACAPVAADVVARFVRLAGASGVIDKRLQEWIDSGEYNVAVAGLVHFGLSKKENEAWIERIMAGASSDARCDVARFAGDIPLSDASKESLLERLSRDSSEEVRHTLAKSLREIPIGSQLASTLCERLARDASASVCAEGLESAAKLPVGKARLSGWIDDALQRALDGEVELFEAVGVAAAASGVKEEQRMRVFESLLESGEPKGIGAGCALLVNVADERFDDYLAAFQRIYTEAFNGEVTRQRGVAAAFSQGVQEVFGRQSVSDDVAQRFGMSNADQPQPTSSASDVRSRADILADFDPTAAVASDDADSRAAGLIADGEGQGLDNLEQMTAEAAFKLLNRTFADEARELGTLEQREHARFSARNRAAPPDGAVDVEGVILGKYDSSVQHELAGASKMLSTAVVPGLNDSKLISVPTTQLNRKRVAEAWKLNKPLWLEGPTSAGKTAVIREMCALTETPFRRFNLNAFTDVAELFGTWVRDPEDPLSGTFSPGPIVQAAINGECVLLDEMNLADGRVLAALNGLLDDRGEIRIMGFNNNKPFKPHPNFRIFAATNPSSFEGRSEFDEAFLDRWTKVTVDGLSTPELQEIVDTIFGEKLPAKQRSQLVSFHAQISDAADRREIGSERTGVYAFSLRNLFKVCRRCAEFDEQKDEKKSAAVLRREIEEIYIDGVSEPEDKQKVEALLDAAMGATAAEAEALRGLKEDPSNPGLYLLEEGESAYYLGDARIPKHNTGAEFVPEFKVPYALTERAAQVMYKIAKAAQMGENVLLVGERGNGKTMMCRYFASLTGQDFFDTVFKRDTDPAEIIGQYEPDGWHDAAVTSAVRRKGVLLIDEINVASPAVIERLNPLGDGEKTMLLSEHENEQLEIPSELVFLAAMNPCTYRNRNRLSPAFKNRMTVIHVPPLDDPAELKLIMKVTSSMRGVPAEGVGVLEAAIDLQDWINEKIEQGELGANDREVKKHGIRTLNNFADYVAEFGPKRGWRQAFKDGVDFCYWFADPKDREAIDQKVRALS